MTGRVSVIAGLAFLSLCGQLIVAGALPQQTASETRLVELPKRFATEPNLVISPDETRVALIRGADASGSVRLEHVLVIGDKVSDPFHWITATFSPDSRRLAYTGLRRQGLRSESLMVFVDDRVPEGPYKRVFSLTFSPDSARIAFGASDEQNRHWVVLDGKQQGPYDEFGQDLKEGVLVPGPFFPTRTLLRNVSFSPDGRRIGYAARQGKQWSVFVDGQPVSDARYDEVSPPMFSPDGRVVAYRASINRRKFVVIGDRHQGPYDEVTFPLAFSGDSKHTAYAAKSGKQWAVVLNGEAKGLYDDVSDVHFGADNRLAFAAKRRGKWRAVIDFNESTDFDEILPRRDSVRERNARWFSPDGKRVAFAARTGRQWWVVVDGNPEGPYRDIGRPSVFSDRLVQFSADSRHLAYAARVDRDWFVVKDGRRGRAFLDVIDLAFSPTNRLVARVLKSKAYSMTIDGFPLRDLLLGQTAIVIDDKDTAFKVHPGWFTSSRIRFDSPTRFRYLGFSSNAVYLVNETLEPASGSP